jgi:HD-GYP domain-containing protein (c-di-GMP phosphodiesterase class II)
MSDIRTLLTRITSLRQRLEQVEQLAAPERSPEAAESDAASAGARFGRLEKRLAEGTEQDVALDRTLRQLGPEAAAGEAPILPRQMTARAHRLLEQGKGLVERLRVLAGELAIPADSQLGDPLPSGATAEPLTRAYEECAAMAETSLRIVQAFPDGATAQVRLCLGLEPILATIAGRVAGLEAALVQRRREREQTDQLAALLTDVQAGKPVGMPPFVALAETILAEAAETNLRFPQMVGDLPARSVAMHALAVAQVMARLVRQDAELRREPVQPILTALLHDAGMLAVPGEILSQPGPLDPAQRRSVETHTRVGAEWMLRLSPTAGWLAEAAERHHERLDGTGYPQGLKGPHLTTCIRLLSVCDVYVALCSPRPYRRACDTRTALTDTLLLAERGDLDRFQAERLLQLSFYPVGSVVELADGAVGLVVATHPGRRDLMGPARPVLALLTDPQGQPLCLPQHLDLAQCESRSIVRSLSPGERQQLLGQRYPGLA